MRRPHAQAARVFDVPDPVIEAYLTAVTRLPRAVATTMRIPPWHALPSGVGVVARVRARSRFALSSLVLLGFAWYGERALLATAPTAMARARYDACLRELRAGGWNLSARALVVQGLGALRTRTLHPARADGLYARTMEPHIPRAAIGWPV